MRARLGNVILLTACLVVGVIIYVLASDHMSPGSVPYWWLTAVGVGLIGIAARYMLTGNQ